MLDPEIGELMGYRHLIWKLLYADTLTDAHAKERG